MADCISEHGDLNTRLAAVDEMRHWWTTLSFAIAVTSQNWTAIFNKLHAASSPGCFHLNSHKRRKKQDEKERVEEINGHPMAPEMIVWKFMFNGRCFRCCCFQQRTNERTRLIIKGADPICMSRAGSTNREQHKRITSTVCKLYGRQKKKNRDHYARDYRVRRATRGTQL